VPPGGPCTDSIDCEDTAPVCADVDGATICVAECPLGACADSTVCVDGLCVPSGLALGETCAGHAECRSGICAGVCTRLCASGAECPEGFGCEPAGELSGCFPVAMEMPPPPRSGGCGVATPSRARAGFVPAAWSLLVALVVLTRRRVR
jgi:hypothetical protein